jgi:NADP-reducing hydrogenase subunit HndB
MPGMPTVIYGKVDAKAAKDIVEKHLIGRELLDNLILDRPAVDIINTK